MAATVTKEQQLEADQKMEARYVADFKKKLERNEAAWQQKIHQDKFKAQHDALEKQYEIEIASLKKIYGEGADIYKTYLVVFPYRVQHLGVLLVT